MNVRAFILCSAVAAALPSAALAEDLDKGFFAGIDLLGGFATGSSSTTNGGGTPPVYHSDGVVRDVTFGNTLGIGGHIGYRLDPNWSAFASYHYIRGDIGWSADYPSLGIASDFSGDAYSNVLMGNVAYRHALSDETSLILKAGLGVSLNTLSDITEVNPTDGSLISHLANHTKASPAGQVGVGFQHAITSNVTLGLDASLGYAGSFETGDTRTLGSDVMEINPYEIENVWRGNLGGSLKVNF